MLCWREGGREGGRKEEGEMCSVDKNGQNARQGMIGVCLCEVQYSTIQYSRLICVLLHCIALHCVEFSGALTCRWI